MVEYFIPIPNLNSRSNTLPAKNYPKEYFMIENLFEEICSGNNLHAYTYKGYFIDIGIPEDYYRFCELIRNEC